MNKLMANELETEFVASLKALMIRYNIRVETTPGGNVVFNNNGEGKDEIYLYCDDIVSILEDDSDV